MSPPGRVDPNSLEKFACNLHKENAWLNAVVPGPALFYDHLFIVSSSDSFFSLRSVSWHLICITPRVTLLAHFARIRLDGTCRAIPGICPTTPTLLPPPSSSFLLLPPPLPSPPRLFQEIVIWLNSENGLEFISNWRWAVAWNVKRWKCVSSSLLSFFFLAFENLISEFWLLIFHLISSFLLLCLVTFRWVSSSAFLPGALWAPSVVPLCV